MIFSGLGGKIGSDLIRFYEKKKYGRDYFELDFSQPCAAKTLVHIAACSNIDLNENIVNSNVVFLQKTIEFAEQNNIENFIFFSAISIYGQAVDLVDENSPFITPNIYSASKILGEQMLRQSRIKNILCLRLPSVLTTRDNRSFLFKWLDAAMKNNDISVVNSDKKFNNFLSVNSLFDFIFNVRLKSGFDTLNLGSLDNFSFYEFAYYLKQKMNSTSKIIESKKSDFFKINLAKSKEEYNFSPLGAKESIDEWIKNIKRVQNV